MFTHQSRLSVPVKILFLSFILLVPPVLMQGWCDTEAELNSRIERGIRYLDTEQYNLALAEFQTIRKEFATSESVSSFAQCYIGIVYQELNSLSEAITAYQAALALEGQPEVHGSAYLHLGIVYKAQGELSLAESHLKQALGLLTETAEAYIHLGDVYARQRRFDDAEKAYRASIRLNPNQTESYYGLGRVAEMQNRLEQALAYYDAALARNRYLSQAHYRRALAYRRLGNSEHAETAMTQFRRLKTYEDRMHQYREALYSNPNLPMLYIKLGELHETYDNLTEASQIYEAAIQVHPSYLPAYLSLGEVFIQQRNLEEAIGVYQKATKIAPNNSQVWGKLGVIYINQRQFEPAILAFKQAIAADNTAAEAYNNLARLYAGLGKEMQQAIDLAEHAVTLMPTAKHYDTLAYTYYRNAEYAKALTAINQALALAPDANEYNKLLLKIQEAQVANKHEKK
ncbi:tetratricopeptide repeat protein [Candidatus Poribacteria bacterium]|nr:tetratricopeptide repeat protein [Candidatus Poribacteria bacterium]MYK18137.1 tetratricopeptide repeat protein [Candidatus Poribacteria bacterium]